MTYDYNYTRAKLTSGDHIGAWDIDNPDRVDESENQIYLIDEIRTALGMTPLIICDGSSCVIKFDEELTSGEETTLNTTVSNHKNNT